MKQYYYSKEIKIKDREITAYKVEHDINGNSRWVVHFLSLLTEKEQEEISNETQELRAKYPNQYYVSRQLAYKCETMKKKNTPTLRIIPINEMEEI